MRKVILVLFLMLMPGLAAAFDATIPVLDLRDFQNPKNRGKFLSELEAALQDVGFFALVNTGVDPHVLDNAYAASRTFFKQDLQEKVNNSRLKAKAFS